jgi:hypothetical protein
MDTHKPRREPRCGLLPPALPYLRDQLHRPADGACYEGERIS